MNKTWREYVPAIEHMVVDSQSYSRDPFAVVVLTADPNRISTNDITVYKKIIKIKGVGCTKRNRYAKTKDEPDVSFDIRVATERALKDLYYQVVTGSKKDMDTFMTRLLETQKDSIIMSDYDMK